MDMFLLGDIPDHAFKRVVARYSAESKGIEVTALEPPFQNQLVLHLGSMSLSDARIEVVAGVLQAEGDLTSFAGVNAESVKHFDASRYTNLQLIAVDEAGTPFLRNEVNSTIPENSNLLMMWDKIYFK